MTRRWWFWGALALAYALLLVAAQLGQTQPKPPAGSLRWGGDATGGAPYIFRHDGKLTGFEAEFAQYLGKQLGQEPWFIQGTWDTLPSLLGRHDIDVVLNGYEWSAERENEWSSTIPYYCFSLDLLVCKDNDRIQTWEDLAHPPPGRKYSVGVLRGTAAHHYLEDHFGDAIEIQAYSQGVTSAMSLVKSRAFDATVQDHPAVVHYVLKDPYGAGFRDSLRQVQPERVVGPGYYVMFVRQGDDELRDKLNGAIRIAFRSGTLKKLYTRYGIWTDDQAERLTQVWADWPPKATVADEADSDPDSGSPNEDSNTLRTLWGYFKVLVAAAWTTVLLSCISMPLAMGLGLMVAVGRLYGPLPLAKLLGLGVEFLRGTPLLMQLFVIFFMLPSVGVRFDPFWAAAMGLSVNYAAYESENYRAGLLAVPLGQMEAALSLGMSRWTALRRVIIPQAVRIVIPPVTNDFIALFKDTSVCSVIAVTELTGKYYEITNDKPALVLQIGLLTALLYLMMSYPLSLLARRLERRFPRVVT